MADRISSVPSYKILYIGTRAEAHHHAALSALQAIVECAKVPDRVDGRYADILRLAPIMVIEDPDDNGADALLIISAVVKQQIDPAHRSKVIFHSSTGKVEKVHALITDFHERGYFRETISDLFTFTESECAFTRALTLAAETLQPQPVDSRPAPAGQGIAWPQQPANSAAFLSVQDTIPPDPGIYQRAVAMVNARGLERMGGREPEFLATVMCSASCNDPRELAASRRLASLIKRAFDSLNIFGGLMFGASNVGKMNQVSNKAYELKMPVYGITTRELVLSELSQFIKADPTQPVPVEHLNSHGLRKLDYLSIHPHIFGRLYEFWERSDYILIDKGGCGTVQELMAFAILNQLHPEVAKPMTIINEPKTASGLPDAAIPEEARHFACTLALMESMGFMRGRDFKVVTTQRDAIADLKRTAAASLPGQRAALRRKQSQITARRKHELQLMHERA